MFSPLYIFVTLFLLYMKITAEQFVLWFWIEKHVFQHEQICTPPLEHQCSRKIGKPRKPQKQKIQENPKKAEQKS